MKLFFLIAPPCYRCDGRALSLFLDGRAGMSHSRYFDEYAHYLLFLRIRLFYIDARREIFIFHMARHAEETIMSMAIRSTFQGTVMMPILSLLIWLMLLLCAGSAASARKSNRLKSTSAAYESRGIHITFRLRCITRSAIFRQPASRRISALDD